MNENEYSFSVQYVQYIIMTHTHGVDYHMELAATVEQLDEALKEFGYDRTQKAIHRIESRGYFEITQSGGALDFTLVVSRQVWNITEGRWIQQKAEVKAENKQNE